MMEDPPPGIAAGPVDESNYFLWEAVIMGPEDTYYEGGVFTAILTFPSDYPMSPPKMRFTCPMWHPNSLLPFVLQTPSSSIASEQYFMFCLFEFSFPKWRCVYLDFASSWC